MSEYFFYVAHTGDGANGNGVSAVDPATGQVHVTVPLGARVIDIAAAPGGTLLYALVDDRAEIRVIDLTALAVAASIDATDNEGEALAVAPDGSRLYVASRGTVSEIDTDTRTVVRTLTAGTGYRYQQLLVSADSKYLYGAWGNWVVKYDLATGDHVSSESLGSVDTIALSADGGRLYVPSPGDSSRLRELDASTLATVEDWELLSTVPRILAQTGGPLIVASDRQAHVGKVWNAESREIAGYFNVAMDIPFESGGSESFLPIALSPDGATVCSATDSIVIAGLELGQDAKYVPSLNGKLPGRAVAVITAAPIGAHSTQLEDGSSTRPLVPLRIPGLTTRLTTADGAPISGEPVRFTSAGGLDLGIATTGTDGRVNHTVDLWLPINPDTQAIDTSRLIGPYKVSYSGKSAYQATETEGTITLD
ncbi:hypothetical protein ACH4SP_42245 [Streptomyces sp. NPDC021093]|uniref:hypothetical protein n=1 Tax=Streptomyces sp. NPDC021093 TaxID=3365112 RepID=UPI0037A0309E